MNWDCKPRRSARTCRRPVLEPLEVRLALSTVAPTSQQPFDPIIQASAVRSQYGVTGEGLTAAVIDTGVNYNNADLGGGLGAGHKVVTGYDFADNTPDPAPAGSQHGTSVAGLIAGNDPTYPGVAPGADIAALRVFDNSNQGSYNYIINALQWVVDNHSEYNISVVNMSLSDNQNYSMDWFSNDGGIGQKIAGLVHQLDTLNIPVVAATGNSYTGTQGMGFIAILPETISVTATDTSDHFLANAQRLGSAVGGDLATDLAAPGDGSHAPQDGNSFTTVQGTSFAAPLVSGGIILLQSIYEQRFHTLPSVDQVLSWLEQGATTVTDPNNVSIGRIDLAKSAALIPQVPATPPTDGSQGQTQLYLNGQPNGSVPSDSSANPLNNAFTAFGLSGTFQTASTWTASSPNPLDGAFQAFGLSGSFQTITTWSSNGGVGSAHPAGTLGATTSVVSRAQSSTGGASASAATTSSNLTAARRIMTHAALVARTRALPRAHAAKALQARHRA